MITIKDLKVGAPNSTFIEAETLPVEKLAKVKNLNYLLNLSNTFIYSNIEEEDSPLEVADLLTFVGLKLNRTFDSKMSDAEIIARDELVKYCETNLTKLTFGYPIGTKLTLIIKPLDHSIYYAEIEEDTSIEEKQIAFIDKLIVQLQSKYDEFLEESYKSAEAEEAKENENIKTYILGYKVAYDNALTKGERDKIVSNCRSKAIKEFDLRAAGDERVSKNTIECLLIGE